MEHNRKPRRSKITWNELGDTLENKVERLWIRDIQATTLINQLFHKIEDLQNYINQKGL